MQTWGDHVSVALQIQTHNVRWQSKPSLLLLLQKSLKSQGYNNLSKRWQTKVLKPISLCILLNINCVMNTCFSFTKFNAFFILRFRRRSLRSWERANIWCFMESSSKLMKSGHNSLTFGRVDLEMFRWDVPLKRKVEYCPWQSWSPLSFNVWKRWA